MEVKHITPKAALGPLVQSLEAVKLLLVQQLENLTRNMEKLRKQQLAMEEYEASQRKTP